MPRSPAKCANPMTTASWLKPKDGGRRPRGLRRKLITTLLLAVMFPGAAWPEAGKPYPLAGAGETTPSRCHYFSWIDNTNEGSTERQTMANLDFFKWLHDEYGMCLDNYAFDAGAIDTPGTYRSIYADRFKQQFPHGFEPIVAKAKSFGCGLGVWLGPDGFGNTSAEEQARTDMLVKLCRDYNFHVFKVDAVCGQLRTNKQAAFVHMLQECRKYAPDLIVLDHRLDLGIGLPYVTTELWGDEAYIDVWRNNTGSATHNRAGAIGLGLPLDEKTGQLTRLVEDHGVCFSSCLDYWEDDLVMQSLSRNLILSPELYGSPWFLRDDEFPKLARICNLTRRYRDILINGLIITNPACGTNAVARGDSQTRIVTFCNISWNPTNYPVRLGDSIGLGGTGPYEVRQLHPTEEILGQFPKGQTVNVTVAPFRSCALIISSQPSQELGVKGCAYEVVRDVPGKPAELKILGMPGTTAEISLPAEPRHFSKATLDGQPANELLAGKPVKISFPGQPLKQPWHRHLASLKSSAVPADAEALYEATCFAANNNAMEIRSLARSGSTTIPQVQAARTEFLGQKLLVERGLWDRYLFDNDPGTFFRLTQKPIWGGALRIDLGGETKIDQLVLRNVDSRFQPKQAFVSTDLKTWIAVPTEIEPEAVRTVQVLADSHSGVKKWQTVAVNRLIVDLPENLRTIRYVKFPGSAFCVGEVAGYLNGAPLDRTGWRASNVFADYAAASARLAWSGTFRLNEAAKGSYLVIACNGKHGRDGAYAALQVDGRYVGAPRRAVDYPVNPWENGNKHPDSGLSYFFPVTADMIGKKIEAVVMQFESEEKKKKVPLGQFTSEVWITAYPAPYETRKLVLEE